MFSPTPISGGGIFSQNPTGREPISDESAMSGGVVNIRERVGKKLLRLPTRSLRSLASNRLHLEKI